jgi:cytochrome c-type biogenesis protein CcmE
MESTWEKMPIDEGQSVSRSSSERLKFMVGGVIALAAIAYLILSGTATGARYFITIDEVLANPEYVGQTVRISGAVIGDTIVYDEENLIIDFSIAHIPEEFDDLALALYEAVQNPDASRLHIHIENEVMPDLLTNEAQAILTGELGEDNIFYASELLLKCPSRYEEAAPDQVISSVEG